MARRGMLGLLAIAAAFLLIGCGSEDSDNVVQGCTPPFNTQLRERNRRVGKPATQPNRPGSTAALSWLKET